VAPGDDGFCGKASRLRLRVFEKTRRVKVTGSIPGGRRFTVRLPFLAARGRWPSARSTTVETPGRCSWSA
jgi:hypothetical protein